MKKKIEAIKSCKFICLIAGLGELILGVLNLTWYDQVSIAGVMLFDGFFKLGLSLYFGSMLPSKNSSDEDEEDTENED